MKTGKKAADKWKLYGILVTLIVAITLLFSVFTTFVSYPTAQHRAVGQELAQLDAKAFSLNQDYTKVLESEEYKELIASRENVYTTRMALGSGILSAVISVAIIVALYRYLRRNRVTTKPIGATVLIDTAAMAIVMIPSVYLGELITGIKIEPLVMSITLIAVPFAIGFSALITYVVARITEWHYNRSLTSAAE